MVWVTDHTLTGKVRCGAEILGCRFAKLDRCRATVFYINVHDSTIKRTLNNNGILGMEEATTLQKEQY